MNVNPPGYHPPTPPGHGHPGQMPGFPPGRGPGQFLVPKNSPMALTSMILGLLTLPLIFFCLGIVTGILAIVFGCIGLSAISSGKGQLKGSGMAWTGIISAIIAFCIYAAFIMWIKEEAENIPEAARQQTSALSKAESAVMSNQRGTAHGNDSHAELLAAKFSSTMKTMHEAFFEREGNRPVLEISGGEFVTYCQLGEHGCAFIVHVPSYRKHTDDAKETLATLAWAVAANVSSEHPDLLPPGTPLAVGLRGTMLYGAVMTGEVGDEDPSVDDGNKELLLPFFARPGADEGMSAE